MLGSYDRQGFRRHARRFVASDLDVDLRDRRAIITGATSRIGYAVADALLERGARVALVCRDQGKGEEAQARLRVSHPRGRVELRRVDLSSLDEVRRFGDEEPGPIDYLVHQASVRPAARVLADKLELAFATQVAAPHILTALLAERLRPDARVVFVSSPAQYAVRMSLHDLDWARRPYDAWSAYAQTKRMQVVLAECWADRLDNRDVHVYAAHPGWVDTPSVQQALPRFHALARRLLRSPAEAADTVVWLCARGLAPGPNGALFFDRREVSANLVPWTREHAGHRAILLSRLDALI
jgi:NAD(P)-dependent dehydrogenase (short-subunit alcohol dehydrogenase family)